MPNPIAPLVVVDAPLFQAAPYGLVSSSQVIVDENERWVVGYDWDADSCVSTTVQDPRSLADGTSTNLSNPLANPASLVTTYPWMIEVAADRISWGFESQDYPARPLKWLEDCTQKAIEAEFWSGSLNTGNQHLAVSGCTVISGDQKPVRALAALEDAVTGFGCGGRGMIHANPEIVTQWVAYNLLDVDGNRLVTRSRGTVVVPGSGYPTSGPVGASGAAATPGYGWAFATGMCQVRISEPQVVPETLAEALNRTTNEVTYRAWRYASVNFDPCYGPTAVRVEYAAI